MSVTEQEMTDAIARIVNADEPWEAFIQSLAELRAANRDAGGDDATFMGIILLHTMMIQQPVKGPSQTEAASTETRQERFKRAQALDASLDCGDIPCADDLDWLREYKDSPEFRASVQMHKIYGDAWLSHVAGDA